MLKLGGVITLRVDIGDFLEFEGALEGDGLHRASAEVEGMLLIREPFRDGGDLRLPRKHRAHEFGQPGQFGGEGGAPFAGEPPPRPRRRAMSSRTATWQVKALVEATEISGPACR